MTIQVTGILNPFGSPIAKAIIQVTSLTNDGALAGVYLRTCTTSTGAYSFQLMNGSYLVEYKQKDTLVEVGRIFVNADTPTPTDLVALLTSSPLVPIPPTSSPDTDWDAELAIHMQNADSHSDVNQAVHGGASSVDYEEASSTATSTLGRAVDEVVSDLGSRREEAVSFTQEGNTLVMHKTTQSTPSIVLSEQQVLGEDTDVDVDLNQTLQVNDLTVERSLTHSKDLTEYATVEKSGISSDLGYQTHETRFKQTDFQQVMENLKSQRFGVTNPDYTAEMARTEGFTDTYVDADTSMVVEQPQITVSEKNTLQGDTNFTEIETGSEQRITEDDNSFGRWFKKVTTYSKVAVDELINNGFESIKRYTVDKFLIGSLFEADTVNKTIRIRGKLQVDNPQDFAGEVRFQVFQYSVDGQTNWHEVFAPEDLWRRHNESVDGYIDPANWSAPYLLQAQDGSAGDTYYFEYQYSADKSSWHDTFLDADIWRRERIIENGFPISEWSSPARIKGADGANGITQFIEYEYSINGLEPWHTNFSTGDHYRRERLVTDGVAGEWSSPAKLVPEKGVDFFDGYSNTKVSLYKRSTTPPAEPSNTVTYNFLTLEVIGGLDGWSTEIPSGTAPVYVTAANASSDTSTALIDPSDWSLPVILAQSGDTVYGEYQYSPDGINDWHNDLLSTDYYRRERTVVVSPTGVSTGAWSEGVQIRIDGTVLTEEYRYNATAADSGATAWDADMRASDYFRQRRTLIDGVENYRGTWHRIRLDGNDGDTIAEEYRYNASGTATGATSWGADMRSTDYFRQARTLLNGVQLSIGSWHRIRLDGNDGYTPVKGVDYFDGSDGSDGADGVDGSFVSYIYRLSASTPSTPTGGSFNGTTETMPSGWSDDPVYSSSSKTWVSSVRYKKSGSSWVRASAWSTPVQWLGIDGSDGVNTATVYLYQRKTSTPSLPSTSSTYTFSTGALSGYNNGWSRTIPAGTAPIYVTSAIAVSALNTDVIAAGDWTAAVVLAQNGSNGATGATGASGKDGPGFYWIQKPASFFPVNWNNGYAEFVNAFGKAPVAHDHLTFTTDPNGAKETTKSETRRRNASNNGWTAPAMIVSGDMLVKGVVTAEHIQSYTINGTHINAASAITIGTGNDIVKLSGADASWRIAAGNASMGAAPFRVNKYGKMFATDATIVGSVTASSGRINGTFYLGTGNNSTDYSVFYGAKHPNTNGESFRMVSDGKYRYRQWYNGRTIWYKSNGSNYFLDINPAANTASFYGSIYAENIVGDIASLREYSYIYRTSTADVNANSWIDVVSINISNSRPYNRKLIIEPISSSSIFVNMYVAYSGNYDCTFRLVGPTGTVHATYTTRYSASGTPLITITPSIGRVFASIAANAPAGAYRLQFSSTQHAEYIFVDYNASYAERRNHKLLVNLFKESGELS